MDVVGWDIGGVNTKLARVRDGEVVVTRSRAFEIQHNSTHLPRLLADLASESGASSQAMHAVTMTAELSQLFRTKRDGVRHVIESVISTFQSSQVFVYGTDGRFRAPDAAIDAPFLVAAANWVATATLVAADAGDAILIDTGTTTTDVIPLIDGRPVPQGRTDPERLASGELVYTGAVRTPVEAIVSNVPLGQHVAGVSAEGFALAGDVHLWRGTLAPEDYSVTPPDGRAPTRESAAVRLARVVCGDRELLDDRAIDHIARAVAEAQTRRIADAVAAVHARHPHLTRAIVTGVGAFLAAEAASRHGLVVDTLPPRFGRADAQCAPAAAVALLLTTTLARATTPA